MRIVFIPSSIRFTLHSGQIRTQLHIFTSNYISPVHTPLRSDKDALAYCLYTFIHKVHTPLRSDKDKVLERISGGESEFTLHPGQMGTGDQPEETILD